jgi:hypothetical protein
LRLQPWRLVPDSRERLPDLADLAARPVAVTSAMPLPRTISEPE